MDLHICTQIFDRKSPVNTMTRFRNCLINLFKVRSDTGHFLTIVHATYAATFTTDYERTENFTHTLAACRVSGRVSERHAWRDESDSNLNEQNSSVFFRSAVDATALRFVMSSNVVATEYIHIIFVGRFIHKRRRKCGSVVYETNNIFVFPQPWKIENIISP